MPPIDRSERELRNRAVLLASHRCQCRGTGIVAGELCDCAYIAAFKECRDFYERSEAACYCQETVQFQIRFGTHHATVTSHRRVREEYRADFESIARRDLPPLQFRLFRLHVLHRLTWHECAPRLALTRNRFFAESRLMKRRLGESFVHTTPYPLWPVEDYTGRNEVPNLWLCETAAQLPNALDPYTPVRHKAAAA